MDPVRILQQAAMEEYVRIPTLLNAATYNDVETFRRLLEEPEHRAKLKDGMQGHYSLQTAIIKNNKEIVRALVTLPPDVFDWAHHPETHLGAIGYLHEAAAFGLYDIFKIIAETRRVDISGLDPNGQTPLHHASNVGSMEIVDYLLRKSVNPDVKDKRGRTPLSYAAEQGKKEIVQVLSGLNAVNPDSTDNDGKSPFYWAIVSNHDAIAKMLADTGRVNCDVERKVKKDRSEYQSTRSVFHVEEL
ncbi:hypothetical protein IL306_009694 [Fusarium sp. DS 682]|nr:hypothetical protein IL306_009694 [Fusarium sp. DS 682]